MVPVFSNWAPVLSWTTAFEFLEIYQSKVEILNLKQVNFAYFCLFFFIFKNSKAVVQGRMGAHSEPKMSQLSQHTKFLQRENVKFRCKIHSRVTITVDLFSVHTLSSWVDYPISIDKKTFMCGPSSTVPFFGLRKWFA